MATHNQFTPSVTATLLASGLVPTAVTLPPVDENNPAVVLQNVGTGALYVCATTANPGSLSTMPGVLLLNERATMLLPNSPGYGASTVISIQSQSGAGSLQFTRGAVTPAWLFPAPSTVVI